MYTLLRNQVKMRIKNILCSITAGRIALVIILATSLTPYSGISLEYSFNHEEYFSAATTSSSVRLHDIEISIECDVTEAAARQSGTCEIHQKMELTSLETHEAIFSIISQTSNDLAFAIEYEGQCLDYSVHRLSGSQLFSDDLDLLKKQLSSVNEELRHVTCEDGGMFQSCDPFLPVALSTYASWLNKEIDSHNNRSLALIEVPVFLTQGINTINFKNKQDLGEAVFTVSHDNGYIRQRAFRIAVVRFDTWQLRNMNLSHDFTMSLTVQFVDDNRSLYSRLLAQSEADLVFFDCQSNGYFSVLGVAPNRIVPANEDDHQKEYLFSNIPDRIFCGAGIIMEHEPGY